jgi:hypothetical protein
MLSLQQNWTRGQNRFCLEVMGKGAEAGGKMAQTMYIHMNKCINNLKHLKKEYAYYFLFIFYLLTQ